MISIESMMKALSHLTLLRKLPEALFNLREMQYNAGFTRPIVMMMALPYE
jgi:hypothetical protein